MLVRMGIDIRSWRTIRQCFLAALHACDCAFVNAVAWYAAPPPTSGLITRTEKDFKLQICAPLQTVSLWRATIIKQFGAAASSSKAFERLIQSLSTKSGLRQVKACMASGTPLHGKSSNDIGVKDALPDIDCCCCDLALSCD